jgi:CubicO group peptidase (beta-lactamase class C family)
LSLGFAGLTLALPHREAPVRPASAAADDLAAKASAYVSSGKTPGLAIAQVRCGAARLVTVGSAGGARVGAETVFEIGSLSKTLTGLLLAQAVSEGRASLQDDVRRYLPPGYDNLAWADGEPVRLGQLVDTTSGLPDYLPDPAPIAKLPADAQLGAAAQLLAAYSDSAFLRDLAQVRLLARPGTVPHHSNVAAQLLGHVVGSLHCGGNGPELYRRIERPLGMSD